VSLLDRVEKIRQAASEKALVPAGPRDAVPTEVPGSTATTPSDDGGEHPGPAVAPGGRAFRPAPPSRPATSFTAPNAAREPYLAEIRRRISAEVVRSFQSLIDVADADDARARVSRIVDQVVAAHNYALTRDERIALIEEVINEITGLGPLEPLLHDPTITEVMVNGPQNIYIERRGKIEKVPVAFLNDEHVERIIDRIIRPIGRRIDETSPRVDARLPDGSRVNAIIPPLSLIGPVITIRRFSTRPFTVEDLVGFGTATADMFEFIRCCVEARLNIFVSGGTGSGKTTLLNVLSSFIPEDERIVTIEDAAELQLRQEHVVTLEARPTNAEGTGEITIRDLLRNAMHMRPDRLIVGECRSGEALDMIQAMTTGHDGSLSTGHANTSRDMLRRLETMVLMTGYELPMRAIREQIVSAVDLIVHTARLKDGSRKIVNITEVYGIEDDEILTQDIFEFVQTGLDENGKIQGRLQPTGLRPHFMHQFAANGVALPPGEFGIPPEDPDKPTLPVRGKGRWGFTGDGATTDVRALVGSGRAVVASGMVYVSSVGPIDLASGFVVPGGIKEHARRTMENLRSMLEAEGSSLEKIVWANWALREQGDFDTFNEEWVRWFPGGAPVGQVTTMPLVQRRANFRCSIGVIAQA
jgi:pilus assembly protein CpaF